MRTLLVLAAAFAAAVFFFIFFVTGIFRNYVDTSFLKRYGHAEPEGYTLRRFYAAIEASADLALAERRALVLDLRAAMASDEGVKALEAFVEAGGTLVTFGEAGDLAIEKFDLPVRNVVAGLSSTEFWSPGSTLRVHVDDTDPVAYGMPEDALATFLAGSQVYQLVPTAENERADRPVTYVHRDILQSGWLLGEDHIADKAAMVSVDHGSGKVVLIGFRAQHRAQTHGTFKLLFNTLVGSPEM